MVRNTLKVITYSIICLGERLSNKSALILHRYLNPCVVSLRLLNTFRVGWGNASLFKKKKKETECRW